MEPVGAFLDLCRLARKQTHRNLTVFALLGEKVFDPDYLLLETALAEGLVEIRELGPGGSVPELRLVNRAERPVLVVEGEELVGAKQNRAVNVTILVAAGAELVIPVSCVEQRRWHYRSEKFSSGAKMMHSSLRRAAREGVRFSMSRGAGYRGDQGRKSLTDLVACTVTLPPAISGRLCPALRFPLEGDPGGGDLQGHTGGIERFDIPSDVHPNAVCGTLDAIEAKFGIPSSTPRRFASSPPSAPPVGFPSISPTGGWKTTGSSSIRMDCDALCSNGASRPLDRKDR